MHRMHSEISGIAGQHLDGKALRGGGVGGGGGGVGHNSHYAQSSLGWFEGMGCTVFLKYVLICLNLALCGKGGIIFPG